MYWWHPAADTFQDAQLSEVALSHDGSGGKDKLTQHRLGQSSRGISSTAQDFSPFAGEEPPPISG
jgi:hypothetical protein